MAARVKICGLTRPEDAEVAAEAGAAFLGVVFAGGPRVVTPAQAAEVVSGAGGIPVLGVFGTQTGSDILSTVERAGLTGAQLHGPHTMATAARLRAAGLQVWRVVRIASAADLELARAARARLAGPMVLAGGLTPATVANARDLVRPEVLDVSSGVERLPGIKDPKLIARFLEAALGHSPTIP